MDIIAFGDFAITNHNGQTRWTFRMPANEPIDFVEEIDEYTKKHAPRRAALSPEEMRKQRNRNKKERRRARGK